MLNGLSDQVESCEATVYTHSLMVHIKNNNICTDKKTYYTKHSDTIGELILWTILYIYSLCILKGLSDKVKSCEATVSAYTHYELNTQNIQTLKESLPKVALSNERFKF